MSLPLPLPLSSPSPSPSPSPPLNPWTVLNQLRSMGIVHLDLITPHPQTSTSHTLRIALEQIYINPISFIHGIHLRLHPTTQTPIVVMEKTSDTVTLYPIISSCDLSQHAQKVASFRCTMIPHAETNATTSTPPPLPPFTSPFLTQAQSQSNPFQLMFQQQMIQQQMMQMLQSTATTGQPSHTLAAQAQAQAQALMAQGMLPNMPMMDMHTLHCIMQQAQAQAQAQVQAQVQAQAQAQAQLTSPTHARSNSEDVKSPININIHITTQTQPTANTSTSTSTGPSASQTTPDASHSILSGPSSPTPASPQSLPTPVAIAPSGSSSLPPRSTSSPNRASSLPTASVAPKRRHGHSSRHHDESINSPSGSPHGYDDDHIPQIKQESRSRRARERDREKNKMMDDEGENNLHTPPPRAVRRSPLGTSCHQCKMSKPMDRLASCTRRASKSETQPRNSRRRCRKKYCDTCLKRCYHIKLEEVNLKSFLCPSCRRTCSCAGCIRRRAGCIRRRADDPLTSTSAAASAAAASASTSASSVSNTPTPSTHSSASSSVSSPSSNSRSIPHSPMSQIHRAATHMQVPSPLLSSTSLFPRSSVSSSSSSSIASAHLRSQSSSTSSSLASSAASSLLASPMSSVPTSTNSSAAPSNTSSRAHSRQSSASSFPNLSSLMLPSLPNEMMTAAVAPNNGFLSHPITSPFSAPIPLPLPFHPPHDKLAFTNTTSPFARLPITGSSRTPLVPHPSTTLLPIPATFTPHPSARGPSSSPSPFPSAITSKRLSTADQTQTEANTPPPDADSQTSQIKAESR